MKSKYLIIVSFDAVGSSDLENLKFMPNFKKVIEKGAYIKKVKSIYPTLTYPAHTTIITGKYPKNHGIIDNTIFKKGNLHPNWYWFSKYIKGKTIIDIAKEKGMRTCSILWPVTGRADIEFNFPEIFPVKKHQNQILMSLYAGSFYYLYKLNKKYGSIRRGIEQPNLDNFVLKCMEDTINNEKPELMLVHFTDVDTIKHLYGATSNEAKDAVKRQDERLGKILDCLHKNNILSETDLIILGDHGAKDVSKVIRINKLFVDKGFIKVSKKNNKLLEYDAICKSLDGSAYIYLKNPKSERTKKAVEKLLHDFKEKESGIEEVLDNEKIILEGADKNAAFMLEAKEGYYFIDEYGGDVIEKINAEDVGRDNHKYRGIHGYSPNKENYTTFFIGLGKDFKEGLTLEEGKLINHGPTIAKLLGGELEDCDGEAEDILT